jgi:hypothetical protein
MPIGMSILILLLAIIDSSALRAQESKLNTSLGLGVTAPLGSTAQLVGAGMNATAGAGYNFSRHHALIGEFMWSGLPAKAETLRPIRIAANARDVSGSSNLFTLTANYRFKLEGRVFGIYFIGGGGMYYRRASLSREVVVGAGTICTPSWTWWGYSCASGQVTDDQTLISAGSTAFGGNAGAGFTIRFHEDGYKFYVEGRYHYAPTRNTPTRVLPITLGFRF